jgi:ribosomal protein S18 acetylase RimI-like enzyme
VADTLTVRTAVVDDAEPVMNLHIRARTSYYQGFLPDDELAEQNRRDIADYQQMITAGNRTVRCAELDGRLVGFLLIAKPYYPDPDSAVGSELYQIHVDPGQFRRGVGSRLHRTAVAIWRECDVAVARLWVWEFNERAREFYRRNGWRPDGQHRPDDPRVGRYRMLGYLLET